MARRSSFEAEDLIAVAPAFRTALEPAASVASRVSLEPEGEYSGSLFRRERVDLDDVESAGERGSAGMAEAVKPIRLTRMEETKQRIGGHYETSMRVSGRSVHNDNEGTTDLTTRTDGQEREDLLPGISALVERSAIPTVLPTEVFGNRAAEESLPGESEGANQPPVSAAFQGYARASHDPNIPTIIVSGDQVTRVPAVPENDQVDKLETSHEGCTKGRRWMWIGLAALLLSVAVIVGVTVGTSNGSMGSDGGDGLDQSVESDEPTETYAVQMKPVLYGQEGSMYGSSLSMNTDGTRLAVASTESVQVYQLVNNSWAPVGPRVLAPQNTSELTEELRSRFGLGQSWS